jgi:hypothetical protein
MKPHIKYRQRFLYSGMAMGRVGAMRRMLNQALRKMPIAAATSAFSVTFLEIRSYIARYCGGMLVSF